MTVHVNDLHAVFMEHLTQGPICIHTASKFTTMRGNNITMMHNYREDILYYYASVALYQHLDHHLFDGIMQVFLFRRHLQHVLLQIIM